MNTPTTLTTPSNDTLITTLINAHGSIALAAERLTLPLDELLTRLPALPFEQLLAGIRVARLLKTYNDLTILEDVVTNTLEFLTPEGRAKLLIQLTDRFNSAVAPPPVQGADSHPTNAFQFNFGTLEAQEDARAELAKRIINIDSRFARATREPDTESES